VSTLAKRGKLIDFILGVVRVDAVTSQEYVEVTIHSQTHLTEAKDGTTLAVHAETACAPLTIEATRELRDALDEALKQKEPAPEPEAARGIVVASVLGDKPTGTANGHLIAAAPDLLALAKQYASECPNCDGTGTYSEFYDDGSVKAVEDCEECDDIRAVIAKAEGKA